MAKYTHFCEELCLKPFNFGSFWYIFNKLVAISYEMIPTSLSVKFSKINFRNFFFFFFWGGGLVVNNFV